MTEPDGVAEERRPRTTTPTRGGDAVYGLGLVGALVWYWQQADGVGEHVVGVLKACVWPAFLVYEALRAWEADSPGGQWLPGGGL